VPPFNGVLLPGALAPWVADVADRVQCPPGFVAVGVLVAAAAVIGRASDGGRPTVRFRINPRLVGRRA
jgi:putative DNA primase/helicase